MKELEIKILHPDLKPEMLKYHTDGAAGLDLLALEEGIILKRDGLTIIHTGVAININNTSLAGLVMVRSSLALEGVCLFNGVGLIDSDYQGEIKLILANFLDKDVIINKFQRVAQLVLTSVIKPKKLTFVDDFSTLTKRGANGFGSTG